MSTFPVDGYYEIKKFPFNTGSPTTQMRLRLDKLSDTRYKFYMSMSCTKRSWDQGTAYGVSLIIEYYDKNNNHISGKDQTIINKRIVYKPTVSPSNLWSNNKMYNWNIDTSVISYSDALSGARALGLKDMPYASAKNTADANGIAFYGNNLMAGEPWGVRYISDVAPTVVYQPRTLSYTVYPTDNDAVRRFNEAWPTGYKRTDSDKGYEFTITPPEGATYFKGRVEWYQGSTRKDYYVFPEAGASIPDDQKINVYSTIYYKNPSTHLWEKKGKLWKGTKSGSSATVWTQANAYKGTKSGSSATVWTKI